MEVDGFHIRVDITGQSNKVDTLSYLQYILIKKNTQGGTLDLKWREVRRIFLGFEIYNFGIFGVRKFWQVFFGVVWC